MRGNGYRALEQNFTRSPMINNNGLEVNIEEKKVSKSLRTKNVKMYYFYFCIIYLFVHSFVH